MVLSNEVVTMRAKEMLGSRWNIHMRWLGEDQKRAKAKEVEPNGHSEATRGHKLHLNELPPISSTMVIP
jgi:hypothetical protein